MSGIPAAGGAHLDDVSNLLGGAVFLPLYKWMIDNGPMPIYRLAARPGDFVVVNDSVMGLIAEVSEFLFGSSFAIVEGPLWKVIPKPKIVFLFLFLGVEFSLWVLEGCVSFWSLKLV